MNQQGVFDHEFHDNVYGSIAEASPTVNDIQVYQQGLLVGGNFSQPRSPAANIQ